MVGMDYQIESVLVSNFYKIEKSGIHRVGSYHSALQSNLERVLFSLSPIIFLIISIILVIYYVQVVIPKNEQRRIDTITDILMHAAKNNDLQDYQVEENSSLWHLAEVYMNYIRITSKQQTAEAPAKFLGSLIKEDFPTAFEEDDALVLIGLLDMFVKVKQYRFLFTVSNQLVDKIEKSEILLDAEHVFQIRLYSLSDILMKSFQFSDLQPTVKNRIKNALETLHEREFRSDKNIAFMGTILGSIRKSKSKNDEWIMSTFLPFDLDFKIRFIEMLESKNVNQLLGLEKIIASSIDLADIIQLSKVEWPHYISILSEFILSETPNIRFDGVEKIDYTLRFEFLEQLAEINETQILIPSLAKLTYIDSADYDSFYDFDVPKVILEELSRKPKLLSHQSNFNFILLNKNTLKILLSLLQKPDESIYSIAGLIDFIPDEILSKCLAEKNIHSIFRYMIADKVASKISENDFRGISELLKIFGPPYDPVIELIEKNIFQAMLSTSDRSIQEFIMDFQSEMLEANADKSVIRKISEWLKISGIIQECTKDAKGADDYPGYLIDFIEKTNGELMPQLVAKQALSMIEGDFEYTIRLPQNTISIIKIDLEKRLRKAKNLLSGIKRAYYKLQILAKNQSLALTDEDRKEMIRIADELLAACIRVRRRDFKDRIEIFELEPLDAVYVGDLLKSSVVKSLFVYLPEEFHEFPLPALRVINEYIMHREKIPLTGSNKAGVVITPKFWLLAIALGLTILPLATTDQSYANFTLAEYLKTAALAVKQSEEIVTRIFSRIIDKITAEKLMIQSFKNLSDFHLFQGVITREMVTEALSYGGWNPDLAEQIIEKKEYCIYCSFALPEAATVCPNCERAVQKIDLEALAKEEVELDLDALEMTDI